jgi:hypothetical protein
MHEDNAYAVLVSPARSLPGSLGERRRPWQQHVLRRGLIGNVLRPQVSLNRQGSTGANDTHVGTENGAKMRATVRRGPHPPHDISTSLATAAGLHPDAAVLDTVSTADNVERWSVQGVAGCGGGRRGRRQNWVGCPLS